MSQVGQQGQNSQSWLIRGSESAPGYRAAAVGHSVKTVNAWFDSSQSGQNLLQIGCHDRGPVARWPQHTGRGISVSIPCTVLSVMHFAALPRATAFSGVRWGDRCGEDAGGTPVRAPRVHRECAAVPGAANRTARGTAEAARVRARRVREVVVAMPSSGAFDGRAARAEVGLNRVFGRRGS